ncbi:MAG TPA: NAD-dependent epimerase/dehydratase family protein [Sandaracinaceae bacterium]
MHVVVTGASGHVGAALVRALLARGDRVRALVHRDVRALEGLDVELRRADVCDAAAVADAIAGADVVFHAAAKITIDDRPDPAADATNVAGTRHVIEACRAHRVRRLVHFSSVHARGDGNAYERSKALAEREVLAAVERGLDAVVVQPAAVIGPFDHKPSYIGRFLLMLAKGRVPLTVGGGQSWVDVRDVAASSIAAAERGRRGAVYELAGHWRTMPDFAREASRAAGARAPLGAIPLGVARALAPLAAGAARAAGREPLFTRGSIEALAGPPRELDRNAARELGHAPRPLDETLRDTYAFFRERGML